MTGSAVPDPCQRVPALLRGHVDESWEPSVVYVVSVVGVVRSDLDLCREEARRLWHPARGRFHLTQEDHATRHAAMKMINSLPVQLWVVVKSADPKPERARRTCRGAMPWILHGIVDQLIIESRAEKENRRDARVISLGGPRCCNPLAYEFTPPFEDPILWFADAVAGAIFHSRARGYSSYLDEPSPMKIEMVDV